MGLFDFMGNMFFGTYDRVNEANQQKKQDEQIKWEQDFQNKVFNQNQENWQKAFNQNQANWEANFNWAKQQQQANWQREDTAIQRRAADLQALGINPLLAQQQGAGAGGMITVGGTSHGGTSHGGGSTGKSSIGSKAGLSNDGIAEIVFNAISQKQQIERNQTEMDLIRQQIITEGSKNLNTMKDTTLKEAQRKLVQKQLDELDYNLGRSKEEGLRTGDQKNSYINTMEALNHRGIKKAEENLKKARETFEETKDGGRNKQGYKYVDRPEQIGPKGSWYFDGHFFTSLKDAEKYAKKHKLFWK